MLADAVHVIAAGVWVGALAFLALVLVEAGSGRWSLAARIVPAFSSLAVVSVIALVATGIVGGLSQLDSWRALWRRPTGSCCSRRSRCSSRSSPWAPSTTGCPCRACDSAEVDPEMRRGFARSIGAELVLMLVVVGVTAALVGAAGKGAGRRLGRVGGSRSRARPVPRLHAHGRSGADRFDTTHVYLLDATGQLAEVDENSSLSATLPEQAIGPLELAISPGMYRATPPASSACRSPGSGRSGSTSAP